MRLEFRVRVDKCDTCSNPCGCQSLHWQLEAANGPLRATQARTRTRDSGERRRRVTVQARATGSASASVVLASPGSESGVALALRPEPGCRRGTLAYLNGMDATVTGGMI